MFVGFWYVFVTCTVEFHEFRQEKQTFPRYDIFILDEVAEQVGDIKKMYSDLVNMLQKKLPECRVQDMFFETDTDALRAEMLASCNENAEGHRVFWDTVSTGAKHRISETIKFN